MKFNILYVNSPRQYEQKRLSGAAEKHYLILLDEELYHLKVNDIDAEDCILFLGVTY